MKDLKRDDLVCLTVMVHKVHLSGISRISQNIQDFLASEFLVETINLLREIVLRTRLFFRNDIDIDIVAQIENVYQILIEFTIVTRKPLISYTGVQMCQLGEGELLALNES